MGLQLALECPTYLLKDIQPLADFDWILTHLVLQDDDYAKFYRSSKRLKVLDNSVNELLEPCSLGKMEEAEELLGGVDLVVPPDFLGDSLATRGELYKACNLWTRDRILPVVQGDSLASVLECFEHIRELGFDRVAVPYDIICKRTDSLETMAKGRLEVVNKIISIVPVDFQIHLLGMTTLEELERHNKGWVKSVDTGVPIVYGMNCEHLDGNWNFKKDKPTLSQMPSYQEFLGGDQNEFGHKLSAIFWNIAYLRKVTK